MKLSRLVLGTFPFGNVFTQIGTDEVRNILDKYVELGGNFLDLAPIYAFGTVEEVVGRLLGRYKRENLYIGSKCGYIWDADKKVSKSGASADIVKELDKSLKRLNIEYVDMYMSHFPDTETPFSETMETLAELKRLGKIRAIGVSNVNLSQLKEYNANGLVEFVQNRYSYLNRSLDSGFLDYCSQNSIKLMCYQVIERGLLSEKFFKGFNLRDGDLRASKPEFNQAVAKEIANWVQHELLPIATRIKVSVSTLAIWWVLQQKAVEFAVVGATNARQLESNMSALSVGNKPELFAELEEKYSEFDRALKSKYSKGVVEFMGL